MEEVKYQINESTLTAIADSIRAKTGGSDPILTENMASEIEGIDTAEPWDESFTVKEGAVMTGIVKPLTVTENGTYTAPEGVDGYSPVIVNTYGGGKVNPMNYFLRGKTAFGLTFAQRDFNDEELNTMLDGLDTSVFTDCANMFYSCPNIVHAPFFDTKTITTMESMFYSNQSLVSIPLYDTKNVQNMKSFAHTCRKLSTVPCFDLSGCTNSSFMYVNCDSLVTVELSNLESIQSNMFGRCQALRTLVLRNTDKITALADLSAFDTTVFLGLAGLKGTVYVYQKFIEEYQSATNWSTLYTGGYCTFLPIEGSEYE